jgi:type II secretory pathway component GspD/PulD (secretin)
MIKKTPFLTILVVILALAIGPVSAQSVRESDQVGDPQQAKDAVSTAERGSGQYVPAIGASRTAKYKARYRNLINLSLIDTDIRDALSALAMDQEINIATATEVSGKISVHLYQVTLEKALHAITLAGGFSYHKHNDVYYIYKPKKATDPQIDRLQIRIFKLRYAEVAKVQEILSSIPGIRTLKFHEPSKTILVEDTPENIKKIETIIKYWDTVPKQVLIEARILEITLTDDMELGVEWAALLGDVRVGTSSFSRAVLPTDQDVSPVPDTGSGLFFNLLTGSDSRRFAAAIDALQEKTNVNTLSTPKVLAIHGEPAKVQVGGQQGYSVATTNLGVTTENIQFIDTGIVLEITPYIDDDGTVLLNVKPSITSAQIEGPSGIPVTSTAFVETWLLAASGETVLIGGLIQDSITKTRSEVPCLGDLPLLGLLFGSRGRSVDKTELVILITPSVVDRKKKGVDEVEAIIRTEKVEEEMKKEPLPPYRQIWELTKPWEKTIEKPHGITDLNSSESP